MLVADGGVLNRTLDRIDQEESDDEEATRRTTEELSGAKILHGLEKVLEGGSVVLTLKDQSILSGEMLIKVHIQVLFYISPIFLHILLSLHLFGICGLRF
nr:SART-1 family protein DOT2 [Ipomoea batatas]